MTIVAIFTAALALFVSIVSLAVGLSSARHADRLNATTARRALRETETPREPSEGTSLPDCFHVWGKWSPVTSTGMQVRHCSLCGRASAANVIPYDRLNDRSLS